MGIREYASLWSPEIYVVRRNSGCNVRRLDGSLAKLNPGDEVSVAYIRNGTAHIIKPFKAKVAEGRLQPAPKKHKYKHKDQSGEEELFPSLSFLEREKFDHIFVDFPNLIHKWMRQLRQKMKLTREMEDEMIQALVEKLKVLFKIPTISTKCLYIAADGVQSNAKYRFAFNNIPYSKQKYQLLEEKTFEKIFDCDIFIPGSPFTKKLERAVVQMLGGVRKPYDVYFNPSSSPGEAEHKITKCIRCLPDNSRVLVISGDSDFYSLCALDALRLYIWIYRPHHDYAHMLRLGDQMEPLLLSTQSVTSSTIHDYLVLSSLLGNDFNKPLVGFSTIGRDIIFKSYHKCVSLGRTPLASEHGIDFDNLAHFLRILLNCLDPHDTDIGFAEILFEHLERHLQEDFMKAASERHGGQVANDVEEFLNDFSADDVDVQCIFDRFHAKIGENFGEDFEFDDFCTKYLASLQFNYRLQINGEPSGNFRYEYSSAPLVPRLVEFMEQRMDLWKIERILRQNSPNTALKRMICGKTEDQIKYFFKNEDNAAEIFDCIVHGEFSRFYSEEAETLAHYLGETVPFKGFSVCNQESPSLKDLHHIENEVKLLLTDGSRKQLCGKAKHEVWKFSLKSLAKKVKAIDVQRTLMKTKPIPVRAKLKFWNHEKGFGKIAFRDDRGELVEKNMKEYKLEKNFRDIRKLGEGAVIEFFILKAGTVRVVCTDFVVKKNARRGYKTFHKSGPQIKTAYANNAFYENKSGPQIKTAYGNNAFYDKYYRYLDDFNFD